MRRDCGGGKRIYKAVHWLSVDVEGVIKKGQGGRGGVDIRYKANGLLPRLPTVQYSRNVCPGDPYAAVLRREPTNLRSRVPRATRLYCSLLWGGRGRIKERTHRVPHLVRFLRVLVARKGGSSSAAVGLARVALRCGLAAGGGLGWWGLVG